MIINNFVKKRLYKRELKNGKKFKKLGGKKIYVKSEGEKIKISDENVIEREVFVYNIGKM